MHHGKRVAHVPSFSQSLENTLHRALELANDYWRMLGRRALAWDASLFTASEWHSAYMAETGNFAGKGYYLYTGSAGPLFPGENSFNVGFGYMRKGKDKFRQTGYFKKAALCSGPWSTRSS